MGLRSVAHAAMIGAGALDGVAAIFGVHNHPGLPVGSAAFRDGPMMAASDYFRITIGGVGGHGALPHNTHDPVLAAAAVVLGLQSAVSRRINALEPAVVSVCKSVSGTTFNVIPDTAELEGTVRCLSPDVRAAMPGLLQEIATGVAQGYGCSAEVRYEQRVPPVLGHGGAIVLARQVASEVLGTAAVTEAAVTMASEDFALYQQQVPGCYFWLGSGGPHPFHHPAFRIDEACIQVGVRLMSEIAQRCGAHHARLW